MPGRAFEYMNQNIGLTQGGLDRGRGVGEAAQHMQDQQFNRQWMTEQRAFERGETPASPFQKWTAQQVIKKWFDRKDLPPQVRASAAKAELHALKNAGQLEGGEDLQPGKQMEVQLPGGSDAAAPGGVPGMSWRNPGGMAAAAPPPIKATAAGPQRQVQLPGEMAPQVDRLPTGEATNVDMSSMFPRTINASEVQQPDVPPPPSFLITRSPEAGGQGASPGGVGGGLAGAQPVPEVKTVRDFNDVLSANREIERWNPTGTGLTFEQRQALEGMKQEGQNYRTGVRSDTQRDIAEMNEQGRNERFMRSVSEINNARSLLRNRFMFMQQLLQNKNIDNDKKLLLTGEMKNLNEAGSTLRTLLEARSRIDPIVNPELVAQIDAEIENAKGAALYAYQRTDLLLRALGGRAGQPPPGSNQPMPPPGPTSRMPPSGEGGITQSGTTIQWEE